MPEEDKIMTEKNIAKKREEVAGFGEMMKANYKTRLEQVADKVE